MSQDQQFSIDVQSDKFLDWLIDREIVPQRWSHDLKPLRASLEQTVAQLPTAVKLQCRVNSNIESQIESLLHALC